MNTVASLPAKCADCGKLYRDFPLDVVLPHDQWQTINGSPNGLLCAACIVERGSKLPGVTVAKLHFPDLASPAPSAPSAVEGEPFDGLSIRNVLPRIANDYEEWGNKEMAEYLREQFRKMLATPACHVHQPGPATMTHPQEKLAALAQRAIPFLRDEGAKYEDDGSNEPLELARDIEQALSEHGEVVVTTDESGRCVAVTRQDSEGRILSVIWEASEHGGGGEAAPFGWVCEGDFITDKAEADEAREAGAEVTAVYTTPPPEQGDALALLREIRATGVGLNEHWLARVDAVLANAAQPEARGVEGMVPGIARCLRWLARTADPEDASEAEAWVAKLEALATPNPVRVEQPEGKGDDPGRMAIRLLVAAGHVTEAKANEALCIAHGFEPGPLAPAAPVGVDAEERVAKAIADVIGHGMAEKCEPHARAAIAALAGKDGA